MTAWVWATLDYWPLDIVFILVPHVEYGLATTDEMPFEGLPSPKSLDELAECRQPSTYMTSNHPDNPTCFDDIPIADKRLALLVGAAVLTFVTVKLAIKVIRALSG